MVGPLPPEIQLAIIQVSKNRHQIAKGAKEICSYKPIGQNGAICIWEAENIDTLKPLLDQLSNLGVVTEVTPLENSDEALAVWEKSIQQMMKK
jgi:hypothetical protein